MKFHMLSKPTIKQMLFFKSNGAFGKGGGGGGSKTFTATKSDEWIRTELTERTIPDGVGGVIQMTRQVLTPKGEKIIETLNNAPVGTVITRTFTYRDPFRNTTTERTETFRVTGTDRRKELLNVDRNMHSSLHRFSYRETFQDQVLANASKIELRRTPRTQAEISDQNAEDAER